jgi:predicted membrane protein
MTCPQKTTGSRLLRLLFGILLVSLASRLVAKRMTSGDEETDEFRIATIIGGEQLTSRAAALRSASVMALIGGAQIDLRQSSLDQGGATLDVTTILGGVQVLVPPEWAVQVQTHGMLGGVDRQLTPVSDLPADAPDLRVTTRTWLGGVQITNTDD